MPAHYSLHRTDAFAWLAERRANSVHAVVTDPPYGVFEYSKKELTNRKNGKGIWRLPQNFDGFNRAAVPRFTVLRGNDLVRIRQFHQHLSEALLRVCVPGAYVVVASNTLFSYIVANEFVHAGFELRGQIARTVRTLRGGDRPKFAHRKYSHLSVLPRSCWEPWLLFRKPFKGRVSENLERFGTGALRRPSKVVPFTDFFQSGPARSLERSIAPHPSLKPQAFLRELVSAVLPLERGVLLDPFMGSGSTIAAARSRGVRSIGLETNATFFAMAKRAIPLLSEIELEPVSSSRSDRSNNIRSRPKRA